MQLFGFLFVVPSANADLQTLRTFAWMDLHKVATRKAQSSRALDNMPVLVLSGLCQGYDLSSVCVYSIYVHIFFNTVHFFTMHIYIINHISIIMFYTYIEPLLAQKNAHPGPPIGEANPPNPSVMRPRPAWCVLRIVMEAHLPVPMIGSD